MRKAILAAVLTLALAGQGYADTFIKGSGPAGAAGGTGATGPSGPTGAAGGGGGTGTTGNIVKFTNGAGGVIGDYAGTGACGAGTAVTALSGAGVSTCTAFGSGTVTGTGTAGLMPVWSSTSALGDSSCLPIPVTNDTVTGTTVNKLAKVKTSNGSAIITSAAETAGILGIVTGGAGLSGTAQVCMLGSTSCVFDNATTNGHFVGVSSSVAGDCTDLGTNDYTTISAGTTVLGTATVTAAAGTRAMLLGTPDVQGQSGGGGNKNPAGATGNVQLKGAGNQFAATANNSFDATNFRQKYQNLTSANDGSTKMFEVNGTLPTAVSPAGGHHGAGFYVTSAGSTGFVGNFTQNAVEGQLIAGYTGSGATAGLDFQNLAVGTGNNLQLGSSSLQLGNLGGWLAAQGATTGLNAGIVGKGDNATGINVGAMGQAVSVVAGSNVALLGNAANSTEGTDPKNIGAALLLGAQPLPVTNGSYGLYIDTATLPNSSSYIQYNTGTIAAGGFGYWFNAAGAGAGASETSLAEFNYTSGSTTSSRTVSVRSDNANAGTGTNFYLDGTKDIPLTNLSVSGWALASTAGHNIGVSGLATGSTGVNAGVYGRANDTAAGANYGGFFAASGSTEGTEFKNVGIYVDLATTRVTTNNVSVGAVIDSNGGSEVLFYNNGTLQSSIDSAGSYVLHNYTVSGLPTCNSGKKYATAAVSDAVACTFAATLTGGNSNACPVFCDGSNWIGG